MDYFKVICKLKCICAYTRFFSPNINIFILIYISSITTMFLFISFMVFVILSMNLVVRYRIINEKTIEDALDSFYGYMRDVQVSPMNIALLGSVCRLTLSAILVCLYMLTWLFTYMITGYMFLIFPEQIFVFIEQAKPYMDFVKMYMLKKYMCYRAEYMWSIRGKISNKFIKCVKLTDYIFRVSPEWAKLNLGVEPSESIRIDKAIMDIDSDSYDVSGFMSDEIAKMTGTITGFHVQKIACCSNLYIPPDAIITIRVQYSGHSNPGKRYAAGTYRVKYEGSGNDVIYFPPYPTDTLIKKGLGQVRILDSIFVAGDSIQDDVITKPPLESVIESAGLRGKFYIDSSDKNCKENTLVFMGPGDRIMEDMRICVITNKGSVKMN